MKKKGILFIAISVITLFIFLLFVSNFNQRTISREDVLSVQVKNEKVEQTIELEIQIKEGKSFTSSIKLPLTKIDTIDAEIRRWAEQKENEFFNELETIPMFIGEKMNATFEIDTEIIKATPVIYSFTLNVEQKIKELPKIFATKTFVVHLKEQQIVSFADIFKQDEQTLTLFKDLLKTQTDDVQLHETIDQHDQFPFILTTEHVTIFIHSENEANKKLVHTIDLPFKNLAPIFTGFYKPIFLEEEKNTEQKEKKPIKDTQKQEKNEQKEATKNPKDQQKEAKATETDKKQQNDKKAEKDNKKEPKNEKQQKKSKDEKYVALTFDDGPSSKVTPNILNILAKYDIKATFFVLGNEAKKHPDLLKQMHEQGHEIANHTISHKRLTEVKASVLKKEMIESQQSIANITSSTPTLFRPPYGDYNQAVINVANESNQKIVMWSVDTRDWQNRNPKKMLQFIKQQTAPGAIILMHDIYETTADGLPNIIEWLVEHKYEIVTVSELLNHIEPHQNGVYYGR